MGNDIADSQENVRKLVQAEMETVLMDVLDTIPDYPAEDRVLRKAIIRAINAMKERK